MRQESGRATPWEALTASLRGSNFQFWLNHHETFKYEIRSENEQENVNFSHIGLLVRLWARKIDVFGANFVRFQLHTFRTEIFRYFSDDWNEITFPHWKWAQISIGTTFLKIGWKLLKIWSFFSFFWLRRYVDVTPFLPCLNEVPTPILLDEEKNIFCIPLHL